MTENTSNTSEELNGQSSDAVKQDAKGLFASLTAFMRGLLDIRKETDREQTVEDIKKDIPFKGHNAWILIFSVFVASIGLNVSSTAVVIGAMLISPLMGPIVGIGMAVAINDIDTLKRSFVNLFVMVVLSVATAVLYFKLSPLTELTPELESRTVPTILDVLVAIFGGLALIVAKSKKGTMPNAIAGVAIATALMPPLCTVGYGLSVWEPRFFFGALYLFCINATFIALSTFIVAKLLRFPMLRYANSERRRRTAQLASLVAFLAMVPAVYIFVKTLNKSQADHDYRAFKTIEIDKNESLYLRKDFYDYNNKTIKLFFDGDINEATISDLQNELKNYPEIEDFELTVRGNKSRGIEQVSKAYDRTIVELDRLQNTNEALNKEITNLKSKIADLEGQLQQASASSMVLYNSVAKDAKIHFPDLVTLGYGEVLESNFKKIDTVRTLFPKWRNTLVDSLSKARKTELKVWVEKEMKVKNVIVK